LCENPIAKVTLDPLLMAQEINIKELNPKRLTLLKKKYIEFRNVYSRMR
jgi:hypothetical protein